jgi:hypothetical protein
VKHGRFTRQAIDERRELRALIRAAEAEVERFEKF